MSVGTCAACGRPWSADHVCQMRVSDGTDGGLRRRSTDEIVAILVARMGTFEVRLDALESQARPFQEDGHLAVGGSFCEHGVRREDDPQWRIDMSQCAQCAAVDGSYRGSDLLDMEAERDAAIARADEAERERDRMYFEHAQISEQRDEVLHHTFGWTWDEWLARKPGLTSQRMKAEAERDAAREALKEIVRHGNVDDLNWIEIITALRKIARDALGEVTP